MRGWAGGIAPSALISDVPKTGVYNAASASTTGRYCNRRPFILHSLETPSASSEQLLPGGGTRSTLRSFMAVTDRSAQRRTSAVHRGDRMTTGLSGGGETHRGHVRETNQDVILADPDLGLYAVFDGMGGANAGDVAARLTSETIVACIRQKQRIRRRWPHQLLERALHAAAIEVFTAAEERLEYRGIGTTVVACLVIAEGAQEQPAEVA